MNVVDIPQPCERALYDEAIALYASMVKNRAFGVYVVGDLSEPGLSHIELLVVTDRQSRDNRFFFSALQRLPMRYTHLFIHDPFILPAWSLRVLRYIAYRPVFAAGRDVLQPYQSSTEHQELWCRTLEAYCAFATLAAATREASVLEGRSVLAAGAAFTRVLDEAAHVLPEACDKDYKGTIQAIRRAFFESDPADCVQDTWRSFRAAFDRFETVMCDRLRANGAQALARARALLLGEESCEVIDRDYAFYRAWEIGGYYKDLASLGLPFGQLFFTGAYPQATQALPEVPILHALLQNVYRIRRRLSEYGTVPLLSSR